MDQSTMLRMMLQTALKPVDMKAIAKARGFAPEVADSHDLMQSVFFGPTGVEEVMRTLSREDINILHLLACHGDEVDITLFGKKYGAPDFEHSYYSIASEYKETLKQVRTRLLRKGILLMRTERDRYQKKSKTECLRFMFPREFARFLPPLITGIVLDYQPDHSGVDIIRQRLMTLVNADKSATVPAKSRQEPATDVKNDTDQDSEDPTAIGTGAFSLADGNLHFGGKNISTGLLRKWLEKMWVKAIKATHKMKKDRYAAKSPFTLSQAAIYILGQLAQGAWCRAEEITDTLAIFCPERKPIKAEQVCEEGTRIGCLVMHAHQRQNYYRLSPLLLDLEANEPAPELDFATVLKADANGEAIIDLKHVPYQLLGQLAALCAFRLAGKTLRAAPDLLKIARAKAALRESRQWQWLQGNLPAFANAFAEIEKRRNQHVIHDNLVIARILDHALYVKVEKTLGKHNRVVCMNKEYLAFPYENLPEVEKLVKKAGYPINEYNADD